VGRGRTGSNRNDVTQLIHAVSPIRGKRGHPLHRPGTSTPNAAPARVYTAGASTAAPVRRLRIRWERRDGIHQAFITLGCAIIFWRRLKTSF